MSRQFPALEQVEVGLDDRSDEDSLGHADILASVAEGLVAAGQDWSRRSSSAGVRVRSTAWAESVMDSGRLAPGIGITTGDLASIQARVTCCGETPCASATWPNAACLVPRRAARPIPPSGLQGRKAMPSSAQ